MYIIIIIITGDMEMYTDSNKKFRIDTVYYQKNIHRRMAYVEGDSLIVPNFRRGARCVKVNTKVILALNFNAVTHKGKYFG